MEYVHSSKDRPPPPRGPYLVVGLARSGVAAALALAARGESVFGVDSGRPADLDELTEEPPVAQRVAGIPRPPGARCEKCGKPTRAGDQFCIHCGHQLADIVPQCPSCHAYVEAGSRFCIFCGADLRQANAGGEAYA